MLRTIAFTVLGLLAVDSIQAEELIDNIEKTNEEVIALTIDTGIKKSYGSGLIIDSNGHVMTNYHVIIGYNSITGKLSDGSDVELDVVFTAKKRDLAVLKLNTFKEIKHVIKLAKSCRLGEEVYAIGNPFGMGHSVTVGRVSGLRKEIPGVCGNRLKNVIQHSADLNPGNSGGPLFNKRGELVGINVAIYDGARGIGFAVGIEDVEYVISKINSVKLVSDR